jgi:phosphoserine phosphatase
VLAAQPKPVPLEIDADLVEIVGGQMNPPPKSREELIERMKVRFSEAGNTGATNGDGGEDYAHAQARAVRAVERLLASPGWHTALIVAHEGTNRLLLSWACGAGLAAMGAFEQDTGCINVIDFDLDADGTVARKMVKAVNLTPYNWLKHGMNMTSLEAIFERDATEELR